MAVNDNLINLKALLDTTQLLQPTEVEDKSCSVCLENYLQGTSPELPRKLPCGHLIGTECLLTWASSHSRAISIRCPWCRKRIVHAADHAVKKQCPAMVVWAYVKAVFQHLVMNIRIIISAVDRALMERLVILLAVLGFLLKNWLPWLFAVALFMCIIANEHRLTAHQYLGILSLVLGFCVGNFWNKLIGSVLMRCGRVPFEAAILRVYKDHTWAVSVLSLAVYLVHAGLEEPAGRMVTSQAFVTFVDCVLYRRFGWTLNDVG